MAPDAFSAFDGDVTTFVARFVDCATLQLHVHHVLSRMPGAIVAEFMADDCFHLMLIDPLDARHDVFLPVSLGATVRSRCVVLKRTLAERSEAFARYIIAHEFAHAWLNNQGRWPGDDPEVAADAVAADWGFVRPAGDWRGRIA